MAKNVLAFVLEYISRDRIDPSPSEKPPTRTKETNPTKSTKSQARLVQARPVRVLGIGIWNSRSRTDLYCRSTLSRDCRVQLSSEEKKKRKRRGKKERKKKKKHPPNLPNEKLLGNRAALATVQNNYQKETTSRMHTQTIYRHRSGNSVTLSPDLRSKLKSLLYTLHWTLP